MRTAVSPRTSRAKHLPDGYTLFTAALSTFVALPTVAPNLPLILPHDFLPIGFIAAQPMFIGVNPALGIATLTRSRSATSPP